MKVSPCLLRHPYTNNQWQLLAVNGFCLSFGGVAPLPSTQDLHQFLGGKCCDALCSSISASVGWLGPGRHFSAVDSLACASASLLSSALLPGCQSSLSMAGIGLFAACLHNVCWLCYVWVPHLGVSFLPKGWPASVAGAVP